MKEIKEVTVFTNGDSNEISTWSNVPFFFTKTLIAKGVKVNRVDISPSPIVNVIYNTFIHRILKIIYPHTTYSYFRSFAHFFIVRCRIKKAIKKFRDSDANIFLTFSFSSAGLSKKPAIQFCDWTYDHYFNYFENRNPDAFEKRCIKREDSQIENSDLIFPLFPFIAEYMKDRYKNKNIFYLGNVINSLYDSAPSQVLGTKSNSNDLLFVGSRKYIESARNLISAFNILKKEYPGLSLHIIGMNDSDFDYLPEGVNCYGYLDKGKDFDRELYYSLFQNAKIFINTTPKWGAFSATIEAMYFYIPVIVSPYKEFVETFGREIEFGFYFEQDSLDMLCTDIRKILNHKKYDALCISAHESVKNFTWDAYIEKFLQIIKEKL